MIWKVFALVVIVWFVVYAIGNRKAAESTPDASVAPVLTPDATTDASPAPVAKAQLVATPTPFLTPSPAAITAQSLWNDPAHPEYKDLLKPMTPAQIKADKDAQNSAYKAAPDSGVFIAEYPIIILHGYRRKIATEENGKMYVWTGGTSWSWACYPEQWKQFSNGKGYEANVGK